MRHLNYGHLLYFWTVAREGGVAHAADVLHVTPQTISGQIRLLEDAVGAKLLQREGRRLRLTDTGRVVRRYADEIFSLGSELAEVVRNRSTDAPAAFSVGIVDVVPKLVAYHVLEPALEMEPALRVVCREGTLEALVGELAVHRLDMVLADGPMPGGLHVRAYNHPLGESGVSFLGPARMARTLRDRFPASLDGAPMLLPARETSLRRALDGWFDELSVQPRVIAEFDDSALLKAFGQAGKGLLPTPSAIEAEVARHYGLRVVGRTDAVRERYYAISVERRIKHPAVLAVTESARRSLFPERAAGR